METNRNFTTMLFFGLTAGLLMGATQSFATGEHPKPPPIETTFSERAVAVVPDNGRAAICRKYSVGVRQLREKFPDNSDGRVSGGGNSADYQLNDDLTSLSFTNATTNINFAIVRGGILRSDEEVFRISNTGFGKRNIVNVFYYGRGGVDADSGLTVRNHVGNLRIVEFSLCFGQVPSELASTIPVCPLDFTTVGICPEDGTQVAIVPVPLRDSDGVPIPFDAQLTENTCVCNRIEPLQECDPNLPASEDDACPDQIGEGDRDVTQFYEVNNDPYICRTVGGQRRCFRY